MPEPNDSPTPSAPIGPDPRAKWLVVLFGGVVAAVAVGAFVLLGGRAIPGTGQVRVELRDRGRVAIVGGDDLGRLAADGAQLLEASRVEGLAAALAGTDEEALTEILAREGIGNLVADGRRPGNTAPDAPLAERLYGYGNFESLRGVYLAPSVALYERRRGLSIDDDLGRIVARAARQILGGARLPRIRSFPEPLRRTRNVEVMVMLEEDGRPRLWRSARGGSIARALITAASVARQRWTEREQAMRAPLDERLPRMTVKVYLLEEDGTLGDRTPAFVERVFTDRHGVAFEHRGAWHYLLPGPTRERGEGSAVAAYEALFDDAGLPPDSLGREDLRLYRLVAREVGASAPEPSRGAGSGAPDGLEGGVLGETLRGAGALDDLDRL